MPNLDVTDVLFDPGFCDTSLLVTRRFQQTDADGITTSVEEKSGFSGVVTVDRSLENRRMQAGQVTDGAICGDDLTPEQWRNRVTLCSHLSEPGYRSLLSIYRVWRRFCSGAL